MERPHIVERVREIRLLWRETARRETGILLDRLEQAWAVAVAKGSPFMMLQVIRLQADLSGLSRRGRHRRADLWPLPDEDEFGELATPPSKRWTTRISPGPPNPARSPRRCNAGTARARRNRRWKTDRQGTNRQGTNRQGTNRQGTNRQGTNRQGTNRQGTNRQGTNSRRLRRPTTIRRRRITTRRRSKLREPAPTSRRATTTPSTPAKTAGYTHCAAATIRSIPARGRNGAVGGKRGPPRGQSVRDRLPGHGAGRERRSGGP